ncbi:MAG TPA: hypothetical protein VGF75_02525, partial [Candidatus Saccharimonadales bacterium]
LGNEPDFVRIRQSSTNTTSPTATQDEAADPAYSIGSISAACTPGQEFDVWNYLHNNAYTQDNDNGSGSAVATGVTGDLSVPLGTANAGTTFNFGYTVSASNATTVSDSANLDCSNDVSLSLVPGSIHVLISPTGSWQDLIPESTSSLNTPIALGNPVWGSGSEWGCWDYRILITYEVEVTPVPPTQTPAVCSGITNDAADIESVNYTANSANVTGILLNLYSGTSTSGTPVASSNQVPYTFANLAAGQQYTVVATVQSSNLGNISSPNCQVTFTTPTTPPPVTTTSAPTSTTLPNTGPGTAGTVGIFAGVTVLGAALYNWVIRRRLAKN